MKGILTILLLFVLKSTLYSQNHFFTQYSVNDNLTSSDVKSIYQDVNDFLWVGTDQGISYFDSREFVTIKNIPFINISVYDFEEIGNKIYAATNNGVIVINNISKEFEKVLLKEVRINSIELFEEHLYIGTKKGLYKLKNGNTEKVNIGKNLTHESITTIHNDKKQLWIGSENSALTVLKKEKDGISYSSLPNDIKGEIIDITSSKEFVYISTPQKNYYYDGDVFNAISIPGLKSALFTSIEYDVKKDKIWFSSLGNGLIGLNGATYESINAIIDNDINTVYIDNHGFLWVGTVSSGLLMWKFDDLTFYTEKEGLPSRVIRGFEKIDSERFLTCTDKGIVEYDGLEFSKVFECKSSNVKKVGNKIAVTTFEGELIILDSAYNILNRAKISNSELLSLEYFDNKIFIGSYSNGLYSYDLESNIVKPHSKNITQSMKIWALCNGGDKLYLGTNEGAYIYADNEITPFFENNKNISKSVVNDILYDDSTVFFATEQNGVWKYNFRRSKFFYFNVSNGLAENRIRGISLINPHMILLTSKGLEKVRMVNNNEAVHYLELQQNASQRNFYKGALLLSNDKIWLGSNEGIVSVNYSDNYKESYHPRLFFSSMKRFDNLEKKHIEINTSNTILGYSTTSIDIKVSCVDYLSKTITYSYFLEGVDQKWSNGTESQQVSYSNLKPGKYKLKIKAFNGTESSDELVYEFEINKPYWQNWWFLLAIMAAILIGCGFAIFRFKAFNDKFTRQGQIADKYLKSNRLLLIFGMALYPVLVIYHSLSDPLIIDYQPIVLVLVQIFLVFVIVGSYSNNYIKSHIVEFTQLVYLSIVGHILLLLYLNNLTPSHVIGTMLMICVSSVVFKNIRNLIFFGIGLITVSSWVAISVNNPHYDSQLFIVYVISAWSVSLMLVAVRLNFFKDLHYGEAVLRNSSSLVVVTNHKAEIVFCNDNVTNILGYNQNEILKDKWWNIRSVDKDENEFIKQRIIDNLVEDNESYITKTLTKTGEVKFFKWVDSLVSSGFVIGVGQDVTKEIHQQEELEKLSVVASKTDSGICISGADKNITWINDSFCRLTGYSHEELIGKRPKSILTGKDSRPEVDKYLSNSNEIEPVSFQNVAYKKNGDLMWLSVDSTPVLDEAGKLIQYVEIYKDITEEKEKEEELEKLSLVASKTDNYVLITDKNDIVEWVNVGFENTFGFKLEEIKSRNIREYLKTEELNGDIIPRLRNKVYLSKEPFVGEINLNTKDGSIIWLSVNITPVLDDKGNIKHIITLGNDITNKKITEFQLKDSSKKVALMHGIDEILIKEKHSSTIIKKVLQLIKESNEKYDILSFIEFDKEKDNVEITLLNQDNKYDYIVDVFDKTGFNSLALLNQKHCKIENNLMESDLLSESDKFLLMKKVRSYVICPIFYNDNLYAAISICSSHIGIFDENDVQLIKSIADSIAVVLMQKEKERNILRLNSRLNAIKLINEEILENNKLELNIYEHFENILGYVEIIRLNITLFDFKKNKIRFYYLGKNMIDLYENQTIEISEFNNIDTLRDNNVVFVKSIKDLDNLSNSDKLMLEKGINSYLMIPLTYNKELLGSINFSFSSAENMTKEVIEELQELSQGIAVSIHQNELKKELADERKELENKNKDITDSIVYAKRLQEAKTPSLDSINEFFTNSYAINIPKDIVSGDFPWWTQKEDYLVFAVADCTGHGVPGAFMTMTAAYMLDRIVKDKHIVMPAEIIKELHNEIVHFFRKMEDAEDNVTKIRDGLDISICTYSKRLNKIFFSGAKRPLVHISQEGMAIYKGNNISIGEIDNDREVKFDTEIIDINKGDKIYLYTDGIVDQFGGPDNRKFSTKRFVSMLEEINSDSFKSEKRIILEEFIKWRGNNEQIDDIFVLGIEI